MRMFFLLVAGLYLAFCLGGARLAARRWGSLQKGALWLAVCLALPGAGPLLLWFCACSAGRRQQPDYHEFCRGTAFHPEDLRRMQPPDRAAETDRVPMEEALQVSDRGYRRRAVMELLNVENPLAYLPALRRALANEDGETSHYASVAIMELRRKMQQQLDEAQARWRKAPRDAEACVAWEKALYGAVQTDLFDEDTRRRLLTRYGALSDRLLRAPRPAERVFHHRIRVELQQKRYARAQQLCTRYLTLYPESEQAVRDEITVCVYTKDGAALQAFLGTLPGRPVLLTPQTLAWVRAFRKEEFCEQRS